MKYASISRNLYTSEQFETFHQLFSADDCEPDRNYSYCILIEVYFWVDENFNKSNKIDGYYLRDCSASVLAVGAGANEEDGEKLYSSLVNAGYINQDNYLVNNKNILIDNLDDD